MICFSTGIRTGVEIDFVIEKKDQLFFIEAKSGERIDSGKLHFEKVAALFNKKFKIKKVLTQNINETKVIRNKSYSIYNPLYTTMDIFKSN